ncbi:MAG TPA: amidohydrolase family protein [Candidatus Edwardsbacteria bacterium]|nr:amidohydrolase family protein [Candidatus Edwardsbacteria bacterium]
MAKRTVIFAETLFDGRKQLKDVSVIVEDDRITDIVKRRLAPDFSGVVTPAFIDAHSHIGMDRAGEPGREGEANDVSDQFLPVNDPLDSIYFDDDSFAEAVDFGVLYSCIVPGSGNLLGGRAMVIRNFAKHRQQALVRDYGFKMALGYNPRSTEEWKGMRPNTRMGIYGMLEKKFDMALIKKQKADLARARKLRELEQRLKEKKVKKPLYDAEKASIEQEYVLEFDPEDRALLELLVDKKTAKVHVHKEDDALYLIELATKYGLKVTADHLGDVHHQEIFDKLAEHNIPIVYGPLGSLAYKVELKHDVYRNAELLMKSKALYGLMTDHPVIMTPMLRDSLKYFLIFGMAEEQAIGMITYKNARILGIDDQLGTIEKGKLASLTVWDKSPLNLGAFPRLVMAEGNVIRKAKD